jgi:hypothetical protein
VRDQAMQFLAYVDSLVPADWKAERPPYWSPQQNDVWSLLTSENQEAADRLRGLLRQAMAEIAQEAQRSVLVDETDLRSLSQSAKRMAAALRFRQFRQWGLHIHHDEGTYIGMDPAGQSEDDLLLPDTARTEFLESYRKTIELMDFMTARRETISPDSGGLRSLGAQIQSFRPRTAFIMMAIDVTKPELERRKTGRPGDI